MGAKGGGGGRCRPTEGDAPKRRFVVFDQDRLSSSSSSSVQQIRHPATVSTAATTMYSIQGPISVSDSPFSNVLLRIRSSSMKGTPVSSVGLTQTPVTGVTDCAQHNRTHLTSHKTAFAAGSGTKYLMATGLTQLHFGVIGTEIPTSNPTLIKLEPSHVSELTLSALAT